MSEAAIAVTGSMGETIQGVLRRLLEQGVVEALLVPMRVLGRTVAPMLVTDVEALSEADPLAPLMPVNGARVVKQLTMTGHRKKLGVVLRACEIRALVELVKFQQAKLENVLVIGIDCLGTYSVSDYQEAEDQAALVEGQLSAAPSGELQPGEGLAYREACQMCEKPVPEGDHVGLTLGLIGVEPGKLYLKGETQILEALGVEANGGAPEREKVIESLVSARKATRDEVYAGYRERVQGMDGLLEEFGACIRCHNCMVNCPICYCRECIFLTPTFEHESEVYYQWAERKGQVRLLPDTMLFHLTRLNHMVTSCVGCGKCTDVCPVGISVGTVFRAVGEKVQALFEYQPGRSLEDVAPVQEFREEELTALGDRPLH